MQENLVISIRNIERITQMQFCGEGFLNAGHSIYAVWDSSDTQDALYHGIYSNHDEIPNEILRLNGSPLDNVAIALCEMGKLSNDECKNIISGWYGERHYNMHHAS